MGVNSKPALSAVRAGALGVATALVLVATTALPAHAEVPEGWSDPDKVSTAHALLVFGAVPVAAVIVMVLLGLLPKKIKGEKILDQPLPSGAQQWIGGSNAGTTELKSGTGSTTGGASGSF